MYTQGQVAQTAKKMHRVAWRWLPVAMATVLAGLRPAVAFVPASRLHVTPTLGLAASRHAARRHLSSRHSSPALGLRMVATADTVAKIVGPEWNNQDEYMSLDAAELCADLDSVNTLIDELGALAKKIHMDKLDSLDAKVLVQMTRKSTDAAVMLMNVATFASCEASVDGSNLEVCVTYVIVRKGGSCTWVTYVTLHVYFCCAKRWQLHELRNSTHLHL